MRSLAMERRRMRVAIGAAIAAVTAIACRVTTLEHEPDASAGADAGDAGSVYSFDSSADCVAAHAKGCGATFVPDAAYWTAADVEICPLFFPCGLTASYPLSGCEIVNPDGSPYGCRVTNDSGCVNGNFQPNECGLVTLDCRCDLFPGGGRRTTTSRAGDARSFFANMAAAEAASIAAFERLHAELAHHGAPRTLIADAARSARDEVRHTRAVGRIARTAPRTKHRALPIRSLEAMAIENEIEGCVRETYGAALAAWQALHAPPMTRATLAKIAADEARHAALASAISRWARSRLDARARARLDRARHRALRDLDRDLATEVPNSIVHGAGIPTAAQARALLDSLKGSSVPTRPIRASSRSQ